MTARQQLDMALLDMGANNRRTRCAEPADHAWWTSDLDAERAAAARLCQGCPVLQLCGAAAEEDAEIFVYAGVDHGTKPRRKKAAA